MNHVTASRTIWRISVLSKRIGQVSRRKYATEPTLPKPTGSPPRPELNSQPKEPSRVGTYYRSFGSPVLKTFLGALFTYQIAYYAWLKLETLEETHDKDVEVRDLQQELREAILQQKEAAQEKFGQAVDAVGEAKDRVVEGVKEGADEAVKATGAVRQVAKGGWWP